MLPKHRKYIKQVVAGMLDNVDFTTFADEVDLNDTLSDMMSNSAWGDKIKDEFFYGDNSFRDSLEDELRGVWKDEKGELMKEAKDKEVVDLMGATEKVLKNMKEFSDNARKEADDNMIKPKDYWAYITQAIKNEAKITNHALLMAGIPVPLLISVLSEAGPEVVYKRAILTKADGTTKEITVEEFSNAIKPYTKAFGSPMEALVKGNPDAILKVVKKVYGDDIAQWSIPSEKQEAVMPYLSALALTELYNLVKFDKESQLFEMVDQEVQIKEGGAQALHDAFGRDDASYVLNLFPHVLPEYPKMLVQEAATVLNLLSGEEVELLFPHIQAEYLANLKESEIDAAAKQFVEGCGKLHAEPKKKKKAKKEEGKSGQCAKCGHDIVYKIGNEFKCNRCGHYQPKRVMQPKEEESKEESEARGMGACGGDRRQDGSGMGIGQPEEKRGGEEAGDSKGNSHDEIMNDPDLSAQEKLDRLKAVTPRRQGAYHAQRRLARAKG